MIGPLTVKIGGSAAEHGAVLQLLARSAPADSVVVHGGGDQVGEWSRRLGLEPRFHDGLRVTDGRTLEVVVAVLGGLVNARLVAGLAALGRPAVGLTGADGGLLGLRPMGPALGHVAEVAGVEPVILRRLVDAGMLPVLASVGSDAEGSLYNINADEVAGAVAAARGGTLLLCTDVPGVLHDGELIAALDTSGAKSLLRDGTASAGMRPKLRAALHAAQAGCTVRIIDGRSSDAVEAALRGETAGTTITASAAVTQEVS